MIVNATRVRRFSRHHVCTSVYACKLAATNVVYFEFPRPKIIEYNSRTYFFLFSMYTHWHLCIFIFINTGMHPVGKRVFFIFVYYCLIQWHSQDFLSLGILTICKRYIPLLKGSIFINVKRVITSNEQ